MEYLHPQVNEPQPVCHSPSVYSQDENLQSRWSIMSFEWHERQASGTRFSQYKPSVTVQTLSSSSAYKAPPSQRQTKSIAREVITDAEKQPSKWTFNMDLRTRNLCVVNLVFGFCLGIAAIIIGVRLYTSSRVPVPEIMLDRIVSMGANSYPFLTPAEGKPPRLWLPGHRVYMLPEALAILLALLLNIILTLVLDGINYIPSTTLRWALKREGRLQLNSNPRIFTRSKSFAPNGALSNMISAIALVMTYGGTSVLTYQIFIIGIVSNKSPVLNTNVSGPRFGIDFNGWGCIGIGIGLVLQALIATWCLAMSRNIVLTWSSNPLGTARACLIVGDERIEDTYPKKVQSWPDTPATTSTLCSNGSFLSRPQVRQPPMAKYAPHLRTICNLIWIICMILSIWTITVGVFGWHLGHTTTDWLVYNTGRKTAMSYWTYYGQVGIKYTSSPYKNRKDWLGLILQCFVVAMITLGLHAVEAITNVARDEAIWRKAAARGVNPDRSVILEGLSNWPWVVLLVFKAIVHWIFGFAFSTDVWAWMNLLPLVALSVSFIILGLFTEVMIRWRPKGAQPATYGDVDRLFSLVDEWNHEYIFWGDKGAGHGGIRKAGTAGQRLADLKYDTWYMNLIANSSLCPSQGPVTETGK